MIFNKKEFPTIMSGRVVRYGNHADDARFDYEINASRDGVSLQGYWPIVSDEAQFQKIKDTLDSAWRDFLSMRGKP